MLCTAAVCRHRCRPDIQYNRSEQQQPDTGGDQFDESESVIDLQHDAID